MRYTKEVETVSNRLIEIHKLKMEKKYEEAIILLNNLIPTIKDLGLKSEAISFRSMIYEEIGDYESAKNDILNALSLIKKENYPKYALEIGMGIIYEKENNKKEALKWYHKSLTTGIKANISGSWGLNVFLKTRGEDNLSNEERSLCEDVIRKSWEILNLPGEPDLTDLAENAGILLKAESTPR